MSLLSFRFRFLLLLMHNIMAEVEVRCHDRYHPGLSDAKLSTSDLSYSYKYFDQSQRTFATATSQKVYFSWDTEL
jgi:hypothetical protein